jgi:hypothetical protein
MKTVPSPRITFLLAALTALLVAVSCDKDSPIEPGPDCTATVSPTTFSIPAAGGPGSASISIEAGCSWSAQSNASWLTVTSTTPGNGPGTVTFSAAANAAEAQRVGTLTVASQTLTVTQAGTPPQSCTYAIAPESALFSKDSGSGSVSVTAPAGCAWTAASNATWVTIASGASGSGNGTVTYGVSENNSTEERSGTMTVAGKTVAITQLGETLACEYSVAPVVINTCMPSTILTTTITTGAGCTWTALPNASWMDVQTPSGVGSGQIRIAVGSNYDAPRDGIVMVRWPSPTEGQNVRIAQAGCVYAVTQAFFSAPIAQTSYSFTVMQQSDPTECGGPTQIGCIWSAVADVPWIVITTSMPRAGDDLVNFTVLANSGPARTGTIRVRDQVIHVQQAGLSPLGR